MKVNTTTATMAGRSWRVKVRMSVGSQCGDDDVDELDADERGDDTAEPVDQEVAPQHEGRGFGPELDAAQGERDECHDDQGVEDDRREDRGARARQVHQVELVEGWQRGREH